MNQKALMMIGILVFINITLALSIIHNMIEASHHTDSVKNTIRTNVWELGKGISNHSFYFIYGNVSDVR